MHIPTSNGGVLFGGMASEPDTGAVYVVAHDNPGILKLLDPDARRPRVAVVRRGRPRSGCFTSDNCQACHGANRQGTDTGVALVHAATDAASGAVAGASRFDADAIRKILATGKGRMPPFPHLSAADVETLVRYLTAAPAGRARGRSGGRGGGGAGGFRCAARAGRRLRFGCATCRAAGRGRGAAAYPEDRLELEAVHDQRVQHRRQQDQAALHVDREVRPERAAHPWRVGFGDDPELAARGVTGTGAPAILNGLVVTASGLVFGAGHDNQIRAWDSATGKQLWSSRFGGDFVGSPVMYEMGGRQYLLVPASASAPRVAWWRCACRTRRERFSGADGLGGLRAAALRPTDPAVAVRRTAVSPRRSRSCAR